MQCHSSAAARGSEPAAPTAAAFVQRADERQRIYYLKDGAAPARGSAPAAHCAASRKPCAAATQYNLCCTVVQHVATQCNLCCNVAHHVATQCNLLQRCAACCNAVPSRAARRSRCARGRSAPVALQPDGGPVSDARLRATVHPAECKHTPVADAPLCADMPLAARRGRGAARCCATCGCGGARVSLSGAVGWDAVARARTSRNMQQTTRMQLWLARNVRLCKLHRTPIRSA